MNRPLPAPGERGLSAIPHLLVLGLLLAVGAIAWYLFRVAIPEISTVAKVAVGLVAVAVLAILAQRNKDTPRRR